MDILERLKQIVEPEDLFCEEPMKGYTTFRVGGPARWMVCPRGEEELQEILRLCRESGTPFFILGRGSNLLVSDRGYDGVVINLRRHMNRVSADEKTGEITAEAGAFLPAVSQAALAAGLTGLEFAAGIPGTMGGGLFMNAGAYGGELRQVVTEARVLDRQGCIRTIPADQLELGYRTSRFVRSGEIILSCRLQLAPGDREQIKALMEELNGRRRDKQPLEYGSAGSTFKRPEGYFAGKLIEDAGLKGYTIGGAQVSEKHAGFVINTGSATAADICTLCRHIIRTVAEKFGVELELEVQLLGDFYENCDCDRHERGR